jgi:DNA modification methylase
MKIQIENGCALEWLKLQADYSADMIYCDPPYALGSDITIRPDGKPDYKKAVDFMAKWEMPDGAFWEQFYKECNRVLKHGGHLLMFGIDRQLFLFGYYSNLAGFETKQSLYWYFISNFPKASDLSKMIDKTGGKSIKWFGNWLKNWRIENNISQIEISKLFPSKNGNITGCVANWELGLNVPTPEQFSKIVDNFNLPFATFEEAEREVIGTQNTNLTAYQKIGEKNISGEINITAPTTDLAKKYDGFKYSIAPLKQVVETIMVFQKPYKSGSCLHDVLAYENSDETVTCGALDIDGNRVGTDDNTKRTQKGNHNATSFSITEDRECGGHENGRFPSQAFVSPETAEILDKQSGISTSTGGDGYKNSMFAGGKKTGGHGLGDTGGCSKILHKCEFETADFDLFVYEPKVSSSERNAHQEPACNHPTLKPIDLNYKIGKLFKTPNPQTVLVPFSGAGSELIGLFKAGFETIKGCELNPEFVEISKARVRHHCTDLFNPNPLEE